MAAIQATKQKLTFRISSFPLLKIHFLTKMIDEGVLGWEKNPAEMIAQNGG